MKFTDLLNDLRVDYRAEGHEHCRPGWIQLDCPFCSPRAHRWRLGYNLSSNYCSCWLCGYHSTVDVMAELTGRTIRQTAGMLRGLELLPKPEQKKRAGLKLPKGLGLLKTQHRRYLKNRKFNPKELEALWNLQGIGVAARLAWRLFIPITLDGQVVSWSTRSLSDDHEGRYITASPNEEAVDHKSLLYGEDLVRGNAIIIVEGPTDAWRIGPGSVATLGTGYSRAQVKRMTSYAVRAICFDSEPAAQRRAGRLADLLEPFPGETVVVELDAEDPGKASPREVRLLRKAFLD